ncbi:MAG TPA: helicase HerA-like domain-containing protein [Streptosporangiaceae bacterium]|nr:helicase HerA-like domain-containing protein [Streptosporangiaceae bacterium]
MAPTSGISGGAAGHWYRVQAVSAACLGGTAERDYASVLPAVLNAARSRRPFIAGWLSRGGGAPLELITNAGPLPKLTASLAAGPVAEHDAREPTAAGGRAEGSDGPDGGKGPDGDGGEAGGQADGAGADRPGDWSGSGEAGLSGSPGAGDGGRPGLAQAEEMLFPWGARGAPVDGNMLADLDQLVWVACPGRQVPLAGANSSADAGWRGLGGQAASREGQGQDSAGLPTLFESALQTLMGRPFAWLIVADPTDLLDAETAELRNQLTVLRRYDEEQARFDADRAERRLAELDAYREAGLWNVRVLVGASSEPDLRLIAPLLVGAADLRAHPYRLRCAEGAQEFADVLAAKLADPADGAAVPFAATAGALAALTGLPRREVPGVRVLQEGYFDVTSEVGGEQSVVLGDILDVQDRTVGSFRVPLATLNRHALVTGATGAGKSQTVRHLLEQLSSVGITWLAIEPVKSEYAAMAARLGAGQVTLVNPTDPEAVPLSVNPLAPEPGYPVQSHIDMVRALFLAAFDAHEPFPQIMSQALQRAYEECGWDPQTGAGRPDTEVPPLVPTLARLQAAALAVIEDVGYGPELQADVRGFVEVRLRSLRTGSAGRFFEGGHPADIGQLLRQNVVLALEGVANDEDKAFLIGTLLIRLVEHLRLHAGSGAGQGLRHVIVLEEAHRLLRAGREGASGHAVELFASMLAEIRAYGEGIVIAEQIPAKLVPDAVKNTALKVVHRLPASDDRQLVGAAMNLDDNQSRHVVSMLPGEAAAFADGMDRPVRIRVPYGGFREARAAVLPASAATAEVPLAGRRSAACGQACCSGRPCTLVEIRAAEILASSPDDAWLRVWSEAYVLAHLTNRARPRVPVPLRERWAGLDKRLRECLLASALDRSLRGREQALRSRFDPRDLAAACAQHAAAMLEGGKGAGTMPGTLWVIPQLQWLHELERVCPMDGPAPDPFALAPPLDYALPGLADRPDVKVGQRISGLRRHPLSMEVTRNRLVAWTALLGEDDQSGFIEDLAAVAIGVSHRGQLRKAAGEMGVTGWLEAVLSWPRRFIVGTDDQAAVLATAEPAPVAR